MNKNPLKENEKKYRDKTRKINFICSEAGKNSQKYRKEKFLIKTNIARQKFVKKPERTCGT